MRLLRSQHFQRRSAGTLAALCSDSGADLAGLETVYTKLAGLSLVGPLPPAPLPPCAWPLSASGSVKTDNPEKKLRRVFLERDPPGLPPLGDAL